ncbi:MAG: LPS export ABC transporter permease LptG [Burkholderiales bacterium]|jgi:lipopolysaccharide export system permease protein|nr:LPS export ABC transporter permease LptG [Burkholderiales bacterium]
MNTLRRYLRREILIVTLFTFIVLVMIFAFFDLINELGDVGRGGRTLSSAFLYVVLRLPSRVYELAPVAALIGTLIVLVRMVSSSELTVMRVSGMSLAQIGFAIFQVGIPIALATFLAGEFVAPQAERLAQTVRAIHRSGDQQMITQQFSSGFWFKEQYIFANIRAATASHVLMGVRLYEFDNTMRLQRIRSAERGVFSETDNIWLLDNVETTEIGSGIHTLVYSEPSYAWKTVLRPSILTVFQIPPEQLEIKTLFDNIQILEKSEQPTSRFEIALWVKLIYPLHVFVMMLLALPFSQFQRRQGSAGFRIAAGTIFGLAFLLFARLFSYLGVLNNWPPLTSALAPSIVFLCVTSALLWWQERR